MGWLVAGNSKQVIAVEADQVTVGQAVLGVVMVGVDADVDAGIGAGGR